MNEKLRITVLTGAGISAESGLSTFRDNGGLWDQYEISEVATPEAWARNPELVQQFYNARRKQCGEVQPNEAHHALVELARNFEVEIITQNVDDLHERAGSKNVLHLHGELTKVRSCKDSNLIYEHGYAPLKMGDQCELGSQLRPHIVWFGEMVPMLEVAAQKVSESDVLIIVGTSLNVYPAASLHEYSKPDCKLYIIDPNNMIIKNKNFKHIKEKASVGMRKLVADLNS